MGLRLSSASFLLCVLAVPAPAAFGQDVVAVPPVQVDAAAPAVPPAAAATHDRIDDPGDLDAPGGPARAAGVLPATLVREAGGPGQAMTIGLRGADAQGTMATLDGVPLNSPFLGGADLSGLALLPVENLGVTRGGLSSLFGSDALGGVVDARTPSALDGTATDAMLTVGSFGTARLKALHAERGDTVSGLASVGLLKSAGDFPYVDTNGRDRTRTHNGAMAIDGLAKLEWLPADGHRLSFVAEGFFDDRDVAGREEDPSGTAHQQDGRLVLSSSWHGPALFGTGGGTSARAYVRRLSFAFDDRAPAMGPAVSSSLVDWGTGVDGDLEGLVHPAVRVLAGLHASADHGSVGRAAGASYEAWRPTVAASAGLVVGRDAWPVWFDVRVRGEYDGGYVDAASRLPIRFIPRVAVQAEPWDLLRLFGSVARAFRLPTFEELHFQAGFVQGNPDLDPEDALTWDAGFEVGPRDEPWLRAAYVETRIANTIVFLPRSWALTRAENSGAAVIRGVEVLGGVRWRWLRLLGSYTFLDARLSDHWWDPNPTGFAMPFRPRHAGALEIAVEEGPVRVVVRGRAQAGFPMNRFESQWEEWRVMLDARVEYTPVPQLQLSLDVQNLLDKRDAVDSLQQPLPGVAFYGSLKVSL